MQKEPKTLVKIDVFFTIGRDSTHFFQNMTWVSNNQEGMKNMIDPRNSKFGQVIFFKFSIKRKNIKKTLSTHTEGLQMKTLNMP